MKVYIIGSLKSTQEFIAKATENSRGSNLRVEHNNVSNDIELKQLTTYQLSVNSVKDADYVVFLNDKDFSDFSSKINAPCTLYFGDETPESYIKAQIKFELENESALAQTPAVAAAVSTAVENRSSFMNSFMTIFGKRKPSVSKDEPGLELQEYNQNSPKQN